MSVYENRVKGHLEGRWSEWFDGLEITKLENGEAILSGAIVDQAALHGMLNKVRDLGLPLVALRSADLDHQDPPSSQRRAGRTRPERQANPLGGGVGRSYGSGHFPRDPAVLTSVCAYKPI